MSNKFNIISTFAIVTGMLALNYITQKIYLIHYLNLIYL